MPFNIQPTDLLIIGIVALLIFGPSRLPEIGRSLGRTIKEFQHSMKEATKGFGQEITTPAETPKEEAMANCKNCGKSIQPGAKFCSECGAAK